MFITTVNNISKKILLFVADLKQESYNTSVKCLVEINYLFIHIHFAQFDGISNSMYRFCTCSVIVVIKNTYLSERRVAVQNSLFNLVSNGFIHTAELRIKWREGIDVEKNLNDTFHPKRIHNWQAGVNGLAKAASMVFNPNHEGMFLRQSERWSPDGICYSLAKFRNILKQWASEKGFTQNDINISRVDFAIDSTDPQEAATFKKAADLLITAFVVKHNISMKNQYYTTDIIRRSPKAICATCKPFEITCYNKQIQLSKANAIWRLELRYFRDFRHNINQENVQNMLLGINNEINSLKEYYSQTLDVLNAELFGEYMILQKKCKGKAKITQFIAQNADRFFTRNQIELFYTMMGRSEKSARIAANNFSDEFAHLYIKKPLYEDFIDMVKMQIQQYIQKDA